MRRLRSLETVRVALGAALGLSSFSCSGQTTASSSDGGRDNSPVSNINQTDPTKLANPTRPEQPESGTSSPESGPPTAVPSPSSGSPFPCVNPTPLVLGGKDTGYDTCQGGTLRRRAIVDCPLLLPRASHGACPSNGACQWPDAGPPRAIRAVLATIAEDETRHAELAWRTVAWAIRVGGKPVRDRLEKAMAQETTRAGDNHDEEDDTEQSELLGHGIVGASLRRRLRRAVLAEVVLPGARELLSRSKGSPCSSRSSKIIADKVGAVRV